MLVSMSARWCPWCPWYPGCPWCPDAQGAHGAHGAHGALGAQGAQVLMVRPWVPTVFALHRGESVLSGIWSDFESIVLNETRIYFSSNRRCNQPHC